MTKSHRTFYSMCAIVALYTMSAIVAFATVGTTGAALALSADQTLQPGAPSTPPKADPAPPQKEKLNLLMDGDLLSVDPDTKTISIRPDQGGELAFKYTDDTKVVGGDEGVAGLATMKGTRVTVTFRTEGKDRVALQIQIHPRAGV